MPPTIEGTTTRDPGPTSAYQPPIPMATASSNANLRFLRTRLLDFFFWAFAMRIASVVSLTSIVGSFTSTTSCFTLPRAFSLIGSTGRSSSSFI